MTRVLILHVFSHKQRERFNLKKKTTITRVGLIMNEGVSTELSPFLLGSLWIPHMARVCVLVIKCMNFA